MGEAEPSGFVDAPQSLLVTKSSWMATHSVGAVETRSGTPGGGARGPGLQLAALSPPGRFYGDSGGRETPHSTVFLPRCNAHPLGRACVRTRPTSTHTTRSLTADRTW